jgi:hypothetical protein
MKICAVLLGVAGPFAIVAAHAQAPSPSLTAPPAAASGEPLNVVAVPPPPASFDPVAASPAEREAYAVPPAPDKARRPLAHERWAAAVTGARAAAAKGPFAPPAMIMTEIKNGRNAEGPQAGASNASASSYNWSGPAVLDTAHHAFSQEAIFGVFTVPTARQAFGACTGGWDYASIWPGLDGWGSSDVLQGGVEADAYCSGGSTASYYSAWVEWYPYGEVRVSSPTVNPGDQLLVEVWNTSATTGYVYFYDYTNGQAAEYYLTAPSGYGLNGSSAEWIIERPEVNGSYATLTNYVSDVWSSGYAWNYAAPSPTDYDLCNASPATGAWYLITMLDNSKKGISTGYCEGADAAYLYDYGSAY